MTNAPGSTTYSHDVVGNRLSSSANGTSYAWDHFNRLIELQNDFATTQYYYLPNGLRSTKIQVKVGEYVMPGDVSGFYDENFWQNYPTTRYRYDGQMTLEEDVTYTTGENIKVDETRYTLGVRGIESMVAERISGESEPPVTTGVEYRSFPLYDGHGNMIATLTRNGTGYTLGAEKRYEVWGSIRAHAQGGAILNPNKGYVANLGHTRDEESGLTYMRARYYEPWTGRFISEDPARDWSNWYSYCGNSPTLFVDENGQTFFEFQAKLFALYAQAMMGRDPADALAYFLKRAPLEITSAYYVEYSMYLQLMAQAEITQGMVIIGGAEAQRAADAQRNLARKHGVEAMLIKAFGPWEVALYSMFIQLELM